MYTRRIQAVEDNVRRVFRSFPDPGLLYHNLEHILEVVKWSNEIASNLSIDECDHFVLYAAARFHDTGFLFIEGWGHEKKSLEILKMSADELEIPDDISEQISKVILSTSRLNRPEGLLEEIIFDADTYHFGTPLFKSSNALVKSEIELVAGKPPANWIIASINLLLQYSFYTSYCREKLEDGKKRNIKWLRAQQ